MKDSLAIRVTRLEQALAQAMQHLERPTAQAGAAYLVATCLADLYVAGHEDPHRAAEAIRGLTLRRMAALDAQRTTFLAELEWILAEIDQTAASEAEFRQETGS